MPQPLVIAYHLIWTAYGCWLPNDPRGSTSRTVASDVIAELGDFHYGRRRIQPTAKKLQEFRRRAKDVLKFPVMTFRQREVDAIGDVFCGAIRERQYTCYACAIMPDHVHLLIRKHRHQAEQMTENLQDASRLRLRSMGLRDADHPVWADGGWKGFLDHPDAVRRIVRYIEENPAKWRLSQQQWPFVKPYDGRPLHAGHSPNSPYARRLRGYIPG